LLLNVGCPRAASSVPIMANVLTHFCFLSESKINPILSYLIYMTSQCMTPHVLCPSDAEDLQ
jgi:hypothetical protein